MLCLNNKWLIDCLIVIALHNMCIYEFSRVLSEKPLVFFISLIMNMIKTVVKWVLYWVCFCFLQLLYAVFSFSLVAEMLCFSDGVLPAYRGWVHVHQWPGPVSVDQTKVWEAWSHAVQPGGEENTSGSHGPLHQVHTRSHKGHMQGYTQEYLHKTFSSKKSEGFCQSEHTHH